MTRSRSRLARAALTLALFGLAASAIAQGVPRARAVDIARWSTPDSTPAQRKATALKEARNALDENRRACRSESPSRRPSCLAQAQSLYQTDMANLSRHGALLPASQRPRASVREHVVALEPAGYGAYGSSGEFGSGDSGMQPGRSPSAPPPAEGIDSNHYELLRDRGLDDRDPALRHADESARR